jgi:hypothetical protein
VVMVARWLMSSDLGFNSSIMHLQLNFHHGAVCDLKALYKPIRFYMAFLTG